MGALDFMTFTRGGDQDPFFISTTDTLPENDTTTVHDVANSLQVVVLSAVSDLGMGRSMRSNMLCDRANATWEAPRNDSTAAPTADGADEPKQKGGAGLAAAGQTWLVAVMGVGAALLVL